MIHYKLFNSINQVPDSWDTLIINDLFFKTAFLKATELGMPDTIKPYYLAVFSNEKLCGIAILQHVDFNLGASLKEADTVIKKNVFKAINLVAKGQIIVLGNLLQTGQHGYFVDTTVIDLEPFFSTVNDAIADLSQQIKLQTGKSVKCILLKDYNQLDALHQQNHFLNKNHFFEVKVQPNMVLKLPKDWHTFNGYTQALNKKYRRRYTTALKKSTSINLKILNLEEVELLQKEMYELYRSVSDSATINLFVLPENHFTTLKRHLKDDFQIYAYFLNETLIGFFSLINNKDTLDTYFLGYNNDLNHKYQIYLNMLYEMIKHGVAFNYSQIIFARTAMEIKSSVGAKPEDMIMYMKHTNPFLNFVLKWCVKLMTPKKVWEERHPFS